MEEESFEDELAAAVMNEYFINIKVDREERPDVDHIYMTALQLMTGRGGWPLNVVALPDGRPVWAASYVPKRRWVIILEQIAELYENDRAKLIEIAEKVSAGIKQNDLVEKYRDDHEYSPGFVQSLVECWSRMFDRKFGGYNYAPKFPLPNNLEFLLKYSFLSGDTESMNYVFKTLDMMALGGIYDHIEGGFSRYSTDLKWHVPHFEKMLYDNAQLVSLYAAAYAITKKLLYLEVIEETLDFVNRELTGEIGNFYSALDADSFNEKGVLEEGAYYVWRREELQEVLGDDFQLFSEYFNINDYGHWENGQYVLIRNEEDESFAEKHGISYSELKIRIKEWKNVLASVKNAESLKDAQSSVRKNGKKRKKRNKPRLDDKSLCSWNALMIKAYTDAYNVTGNEEFLYSARSNADFILGNMIQDDGSLFHNYAGGRASVNGFLEDYSMLIQAFISLYQGDFDEKWLEYAKVYAQMAIDHFYDEKSGMFFFTSDRDAALISRSIETYDGVISSGNSVMARNLFMLSHYFQIGRFMDIAMQMLKNMLGNISSNSSSYSNWLSLYLDSGQDFYEIAINGPKAIEFAAEIKKAYIPDVVIAASAGNSELPLLKNCYSDSHTNIYVCVDGACQMPVKTPEEANAMLNRKK
jgi:uncharacterized protein YyaL (SSP411 family)